MHERREGEQVQFVVHLDGRCRHPEALVTCDAVAVKRVSSRPHHAAGEVVVDLEGDGALARPHGAEGEAELRHGGDTVPAGPVAGWPTRLAGTAMIVIQGHLDIDPRTGKAAIPLMIAVHDASEAEEGCA